MPSALGRTSDFFGHFALVQGSTPVMHSQREKDVDHWINIIKKAYSTDRIDEAISLAEEALVVTKNDAAISEIAGILAFSDGNEQEAVRLIGNAMFEKPLTIPSQLILLRINIRRVEIDSAMEMLEFLFEQIRRVPCQLLPDLTYAAADLGRFDLAIEICREAYRRHPEDDHAIFGVAYYMRKQGYPAEILKGIVAHAISLNPRSCLYRINYALLCISLGQWQEAYRHIEYVPDEALGSLNCPCTTHSLIQLFLRQGDVTRLQRITQNVAMRKQGWGYE